MQAFPFSSFFSVVATGGGGGGGGGAGGRENKGGGFAGRREGGRGETEEREKEDFKDGSIPALPPPSLPPSISLFLSSPHFLIQE